MPGLPPELTIECPECSAKRGQWCVSRHAVRIHRMRTARLASLEKRADEILRRGREKSW